MTPVRACEVSALVSAGGEGAADVLGEVTSFVGRQQEVTDVKRLLGTGRLVTLTGPGGVGKTRLAERVMRGVARAFADGVVFVGLAELRDAQLLANLVAERLGLQDVSGRTATEVVFDYLRERRVLLVLDNCEHLIDDCAKFTAALLAVCPRVVVLATSRQSLGVAGEHVHPVLPLSVSDDAVRLFVDRATAVAPTFEVTPENADDVVQVCRQLDGLPLAIELAAAWIRSLSVQQVAERLSSRFSLLTSARRMAPERQRTLRDTVEWSYGLCSSSEQAVWARASVFAGSFDLEAAEYVCSGPDVHSDSVLALVDGLLDKSVLLREEDGDQVRYRMLETLREYGQERLEEWGDLARVARQHRDFFDRLTEQADTHWCSPEQTTWVMRLRRDHANVRAALSWSLSEPGEAGVALRMACRIDEYWGQVRGLNDEAQMWLDRALAATPADHPDRPLAVTVSALYSLWRAKLDDGEARLAQAAELAPRDDEVLQARITHIRSFLAMLRLDLGTTQRAAAAAAVFARHGMTRRELHPLFIQGVAAAYEGDLQAGRRALRRMAALSESCGEVYYQAMAQFGLAMIEVEFGAEAAADAAASIGLRAEWQIGARGPTAYIIDNHAWVADRQGDHRRAATLFGAAATIWQAIGSTPDVAVSLPHRRHLKSARSALGEEKFDEAFAAGRAMSEEEAVRYALREDDAESEPPAEPASPLTKREAEIAALVAEGLSNRDIATKLVIAPRTADTHVQHILTKLDFTNRAQIAAWVVGQGG